MVLEKINHPNDIKNLKKEELPLLADEIREFLIRTISESGGHLASNLGVVELTMAMHLVFDLPKDKMIWDVGHQAYTHKLLTGRRENFANLRKFGGMSGFPKRCESSCDSFDTGHSSTSISAGLGYVAARDLQGEDYSVISVIGDGSLTGGMAYEAMNNAARLKSNFIIVLNDNNMSISENVGGMSDYLGKLRTNDAYQELKQGVSDTLKKIPVYGDRVVRRIKKTKSGIKQLFIPGMWFEEMGLTPGKSTVVGAPLIEESPLCIECRVKEILSLGSHDMFIADVVNVRADERHLNAETGKLELAEANPLVYVHGGYYELGNKIGKFGWSVEKKK